ncbi:spermidine synthase [Halothece sp. PCC 7418]|uniref:fused MFS/spermidine synthase n=1 Tax=Halothece sp. (strain PCC 7418) TaxID=65093 RepID=UPI0002A0808D|nr:fused MFS/spermidine synthase [Halothece sp. PCC 7418]AFZ43089.1 spermidine synthase [Halothece sp. PCC 7418]
MAGSELKADFWITEYITPWDIYVHGITETLAYQKTAFQEMYIVKSGAYGKGLVLDGKWQSSTVDEYLYHEALVHPAMIAQGNPKKVLVLGGGEGATIREVLRWKTVEKVKMVDIDGEVVAACKQHLPEMHAGAFDDPRTELVIGDALAVLDNSEEEWDVVISDLSDPIEEGPSFKLFTKEFFEKINRILAPNGKFVLQAGPVADPYIATHARLVNTLKTVFEHNASYTTFVPTYGEPWSFTLSSHTPLETRPEPEAIDQLLEDQTTGDLGLIDGITVLGLFQTPAYIRRAIAQYQEIFTLSEPPKFFGKGVSSDQ